MLESPSSGKSTGKRIRYAYSLLYGRWAQKLKPSMRQVHRAGEKTFIDFSGKRPELTDPRTGTTKPVELFVAALGASGYTYAEATPSRNSPTGSAYIFAWWSSSADRAGSGFPINSRVPLPCPAATKQE